MTLLEPPGAFAVGAFYIVAALVVTVSVVGSLLLGNEPALLFSLLLGVVLLLGGRK